MTRLFMGLDSSTQSLSVVIIDPGSRRIVCEESVNFARDLPAFETDNGVVMGAGGEVHSYPTMWLEALDLLLTRLKDRDFPLDHIAGISGSGQQHGSVYFNELGLGRLEFLNASNSLRQNLDGGFSRSTSPVWMDSSTGEECREITQAVGGSSVLATRTGSTAFERFTGPQIRKFYKQDPQGYAHTARIHLVSSFLASVLAGRDAAIDPGDGAGMNLMDIEANAWWPEALEATAPGLLDKLPGIRDSRDPVGPISPYFVQRYGFNPSCRCLVWSGDNPCTVIGLGLIKPGMTAISLGTSDTVMGVMDKPVVSKRGEGHVFGSPTGGYMSLICFKNGSLAREAVREQFGLGWDEFSENLKRTLPGNQGAIMLPWFESEITPHAASPGVYRHRLREDDEASNCRAVIEGQMMSMKLHMEWMGEPPKSIFVTGGASANRDILQIMANVFGCVVYPFEVTNGAGLGAALRAFHGVESLREGLQWDQAVSGFAEPDQTLAVRPRPDAIKIYQDMIQIYKTVESEQLTHRGDS